MLIDRRQERVCVALKSPREGSTDRLRCLPRRLFEAQGDVVLPTWRAARTGFVIFHALGLGCRRREAHDPTLLTLYGVKYGVKIPHFVRHGIIAGREKGGSGQAAAVVPV